jgi:hypothetical protein
MSTSVAYLTKRLRAIGRDDLVLGAERGEYSYLAAAEWCGLVTRRPATGNGSQNAAKRRAWALMKAERRSQEGLDLSQEAPRNGRAAPDMPDLAAAIAEWEEAQKPPPPRDRGLDDDEKGIASTDTLGGPQATPFPAQVIPCAGCRHPQAAAALREVLNVYMAARRGEPPQTGSTLPRACCQWLVRRPDPRALIA